MIDLEHPAADTIRMERMLDAPIETVWRWLVEPELRSQWFAGGAIESRDGGAVELVFDHDNLSTDDVPTPERYKGSKGHVARETVVAYDPPHRLAFTWDGGKEGVATFDLSADGERTKLVLTHNGITGPAGLVSFGGGWHSHLAVLQAKLSGGSVRDFWALHAQSEAVVKQALA
ncbi:MAG: SRPBCC family protein [Pseudomonadota bacterium]